MWNVTLMLKTFPTLTMLFALVPSPHIQLFSLQAYHQLYDSSSELDGDKVIMHLKQQPDISIRYDIRIPMVNHQSNLPIIINTIWLDLTSTQLWPLLIVIQY